MNAHGGEYEGPLARVDRQQLHATLLQMAAALQHFAANPSRGYTYGGEPWDDRIMARVRALLETIVELDTLLMFAPSEQVKPIHSGERVRTLVTRSALYPHQRDRARRQRRLPSPQRPRP